MQARTQVYSVKQLRGREASAPQFQTSKYSSKLFKISIFFKKKKSNIYLLLFIYFLKFHPHRPHLPMPVPW
jgi:hypothetical protein